MLHYFPAPYPDETLYSIIARYHMHTGNIYHKNTIDDLFGGETHIGITNAPFYIHRGGLYSKIKSVFKSVNDVIYNHTAYPTIVFFMTRSKKQEVLKLLKSKTPSKSGRSSLIHHISVDNYLKHCPMCMQNDISFYGETYWHRIHQIDGVMVCPIHKVLLKRTKYNIRKNHFTLPSEKNLFVNLFEEKIDNYTFNLMYRYARDVLLILKMKVVIDTDDILNIYKKEIKAKGYAVKGYKLREDFLRFYKENSLECFGISSSFSKISSMLFGLLRDDKSKSTKYHLLFIIFLYGSVKGFVNKKNRKYLSKETSQLPYGEGPWPCLNPACINYNKKVIKSVQYKKSYKSKKNYGVFKCKCGYKYSRDEFTTNEFSYSVVITLGPIWKSKFQQMVKEGKGNLHIAKELHTTSSAVRGHRSLLNKENKPKNDKEKIMIEKEKTLLEKRNLWHKILGSKEDIYYKEYVNLYNWLYRNDRQWLQKQIENKKEFNCKGKDKELLSKVTKLAENWSQFEKEKLRRITRTALFNELGIRYKSDYQKRYPLTENFMAKIVETPKSFKIRRIEKAIEIIRESNEIVSVTNVMRIIGNKEKETHRFIEFFLRTNYPDK